MLWRFKIPWSLVVALTAMFAAAAKADALDQWRWRNPLPQGNNLNAITVGNGAYVAVGLDQ